MDCKNTKCYRYRHCWACEHWLVCEEKPIGTCFECRTKDCPEPVEEECESCKLPEVE